MSFSTEVDALAAVAVVEASVLAQLLRACSNSWVQWTHREASEIQANLLNITWFITGRQMLYISLLYTIDVWMKLNLQLHQVLRKYSQKYFEIFKYQILLQILVIFKYLNTCH